MLQKVVSAFEMTKLVYTYFLQIVKEFCPMRSFSMLLPSNHGKQQHLLAPHAIEKRGKHVKTEDERSQLHY